MPTLIKIELYGEYVKARNEVSKERLLELIDSEEDDIQFPELTPKHPLFRKFTPGEIFSLKTCLEKIW
ncbi:hypothetical protein [Terribacillus saccharophilus]|uniref:Uncharacterized protein n=1 Tax=Terribacillus saccharophilus TaxID=361277 RepID=A0ABX4H0R8_9BACI|nr:hypothetical protein [Terribacillus saccharophilus]PAD36317.1 hypothetical protein CHH56_04810 [Terribacillus saccharophilus]PAD95041.1 hypothetical protein CHH50_15675 [Terribacillus saccharophilus]PAE00736.1 hypothetical protein CHH48_05515 [Terribacillus saccharophilus]